MEIQPGDVKFLRVDETLLERVYAVKSPLTHQWMEFRISEKCFNSKSYVSLNLPAIGAVTEYYVMMRKLLPRFRDFQVLNHDVTSLSEEESRIFGVKAPPRARRQRRKYDTLGNFTSGED